MQKTTLTWGQCSSWKSFSFPSSFDAVWTTLRQIYNSRFDVVGWRKNGSQSKSYKGFFFWPFFADPQRPCSTTSSFYIQVLTVRLSCAGSVWLVKVQNWLRQISGSKPHSRHEQVPRRRTSTVELGHRKTLNATRRQSTTYIRIMMYLLDNLALLKLDYQVISECVTHYWYTTVLDLLVTWSPKSALSCCGSSCSF